MNANNLSKWVIASGFVLLLAGVAGAQVYTQTKWIHVTLYDYHANETNPNFQPAGLCADMYDQYDAGNQANSDPYLWANQGVRVNMVLPNLGQDRKPIINPANGHAYHSRLNDWFRPSGNLATSAFAVSDSFQGTWTLLRAAPTERANEWVGQNYSATDAMANIVVYDSLLFNLTSQATGTYQYASATFFPLDGNPIGTRGFGIEPTTSVCGWHDPNTARHNYSFAMEIHRTFTYRRGLTFQFEGDDDVWCFVDGKMIMDLGGIHGPIARTVDLNNLALDTGKVYNFDFFYCERNVTGSDIKISTNIVSAVPPRPPVITAQPSNTIWVGDTVSLSAQVLDNNGDPQPAWAAAATWRVDPASNGLLASTGANVKFVGRAPGVYTIYGRACNPQGNNLCAESFVTITVLRAEITAFTVTPATGAIQSGTTLALRATVLDNYRNNNQHDVTSVYGPKVTWTITMSDSGDRLGGERLNTTNGASVTFFGYRAYNCYNAIATVTDTTNSRVWRDTSRICVSPGPAYRIVVEGDTIITLAELRDSNPQALVALNSTANSATVAAIVRDSVGNYVRLANRTTTTWATSDSAVATVQAVAGAAMLGRVSRVTLTNGNCVGTATEGALRPDNFAVQIREGEVRELFFVNIKTGVVQTAVNMNTDDSMSLKLRAVLSTGDTVDWTGDWDLTPGALTYDGPEPPSSGGTWTYRPNVPGTGQLCASSGSVNKCLAVNITPAPPSRVEMSILTPVDQRIAGQPILVQVRIYNMDGLVPGQYCFRSDSQAVYADATRGTGQPDPTVSTDGATVCINRTFQTTPCKIDECFSNGIDTLSTVFYYAPENREPHQLALTTGRLTGTTERFVVLPGPLHHMELSQDQDGNLILPDTVTISTEGYQPFWAQGYDEWDNPRGTQPSVWTTSGTLSSPSGNIRAQLSMGGLDYPNGGSGLLTATAQASTIKTSNFVRIQSSDPRVETVVSRDLNANGYLDAVELRFNKPTDLSGQAGQLASIFDVTHPSGANWTPLAVTKVNDSVWVLTFAEDRRDTVPQTSWLPEVTVQTGVPGVISEQLAPVNNVLDGAAPVIWRVFKVIDESGDVRENTIKVIFSEPVQSPGGSIALGTPPESLFVVYQRSGSDTTEVPGSVLNGIMDLSSVKDTTVGDQSGNPQPTTMVEFKLTNGRDLYSHYYLNIRTYGSAIPSLVVDVAAGNVPTNQNQKVRVVPLGTIGFDPQPVPNPSGPDTRQPWNPTAGDLSGGYQQGAFDYVQAGGGGFALVFPITVPDPACGQKIKVTRRIYDIAGNLVNQAYDPDLLQSLRDGGYDGNLSGGATVDQVELYWDGFSQQGKPVAPGVYREVIYLQYECGNEATKAFVNYGVRLPEVAKN